MDVPALLAEYKASLHSAKRQKDFNEWVDLINSRGLINGVSVDFSASLKASKPLENQRTGLSETSNSPKGLWQVKPTISQEEKIRASAEKQYSTETALGHALFPNEFGLNVASRKGEYGLPEFIISKNKKFLGLVRFSSKDKRGVEENILEFAKFGPAGSMSVIAQWADMDSVEKFAKVVLKTLSAE